MKRERGDPLPGAPEPWAPSAMPPFRGRPPYLMSEMILAEPALAERLLHRLAADDLLGTLATAIRDTVDARLPVQVTGCGTSEHAAMAIAALLGEVLGLVPGRDVTAHSALEVARRPLGRGLLIGVSHEGGTPATNEAMRAAREAGARTALVTVSGGSPGAALAEIVIHTDEQDQSWCHTVGYLSPLLVGLALAARLRGQRADALAVRALLDVADDARPAAGMAAALGGVDRLIVIGTGIDLISARELALKVAEGARLPATAIELETVLHGHLAAANRWTGMVLIDTGGGPAFVGERGSRVLAAARAIGLASGAILAEDRSVGVPSADTPAGRIVLPHTARVSGVAGALLGSAMALQLLTERLARARKVNPDTLGREDPAQAAAHAEA